MINSIDELKLILREDDIPFFTDEQISKYIALYETLDLALYAMLMVKAENTQMQIAGMSTQDTSSYFRKLARQYRPNNSGILKG
nr:MAG TPA: hypothetical protein [Caudoviricetes sp.]